MDTPPCIHVCTVCATLHRRRRVQPASRLHQFNNISLHLPPHASAARLEDLLAAYTALETLDGVTCEACSVHAAATVPPTVNASNSC